MVSQPTPNPAAPNLDRYLVIHVATTYDEHGVYVTKDSAKVIGMLTSLSFSSSFA